MYFFSAQKSLITIVNIIFQRSEEEKCYGKAIRSIEDESQPKNKTAKIVNFIFLLEFPNFPLKKSVNFHIKLYYFYIKYIIK